jgi:hypothetical protein
MEKCYNLKKGILLLLSLIAFGYSAHSQSVVTWTGNGTTTNWSDAANWNFGTPNAGQQARFNNDATVTFITSPTVRLFDIRPGATVTLDIGNQTLNAGASTVSNVVRLDAATLVIASGTFNATTSTSRDAVQFRGTGGTFNVGAGATVNLTGQKGFTSKADAIDGTINNSGTININAVGTDGIALNTSDPLTLVNDVCAVINLGGSKIKGLTTSAPWSNITNNGLITFTGGGLGGGVTINNMNAATNNGFYDYDNSANFATGNGGSLGVLVDNGIELNHPNPNNLVFDAMNSCSVTDLSIDAAYDWFSDAAGTTLVGSNDATGAFSFDDDVFTSNGTQTIYTCFGSAFSLTISNVSGDCVSDTPPTVVCSNVTAMLGINGMVTIAGADVDGGSTDDQGIVSFDVSPNTFDCSNIGNNTVTLTITDTGGNTDNCMATVTVADQTPPMVTCNDVTVQLDANGVGTLTVAEVLNTATDNCGVVPGGQLTQSSFACGDAGSGMVTLSVTDVNGLTGSCQANVTISDSEAPTAVCMDITVQLDAAGAATIVGADLDGGSTDNCGPLTFSASTTTFGCGDVGDNTITLTVTDAGNNSDDCTATVTVEDNVAPIATCQTVSADLDDNGEGAIVPSDIDGGSFDACGFVLEASQLDFSCENIGPNVVTLTVTDPSGNESTCVATVNVNDLIPAVILCRPPVHSDNDPGLCGAAFPLLPPVVIAENCSINNVSSNAPTLFPVGTTTVTWTLTDAGGNDTQCSQTVTIADVEGPTVQCGQPFHAYTAAVDLDNPPFPFDNSCQFPSYLLDPVQSVTDNCGFGSNSVTNDAPQFFPPGQYTVTYTFTDLNGNESTCEQSVKVWDITPPQLTFCPNDVVVEATDTNGGTAFWSLPTATENCAQNQIFLSEVNGLESGDFFPLGETNVTYELTDQNGNDVECAFTVTVLPADQMFAIAGMMATENVETIQDVEVYINGGMNSINMTLTDGLYNFSVPVDGDYSVTPQKNMDILNGVTTYDLVLIQKHIIGEQILDSPYKMIAADINNSGGISTLDLVQLRKVILLVEDEFPNNSSWRFIDQAYTWINPQNPFTDDLPEFININNLEENIYDADFVGVKIGDVNGSAASNGLLGADDRSSETLILNVSDEHMYAGETRTIELKATDFNQLGFQFTLNFLEDQVVFEHIDSDLLTMDNFGFTKMEEGAINVSWNEATARKLAAETALIRLTLTAKTDVSLSEVLSLNSRFTTAEAYGNNGELQDVNLSFDGNIASAFQLYQNTPNPFADQTTINFNLAAEGEVTLLINDMAGKVVYETKINGTEGLNQITLLPTDLPNGGVYYYSVATRNEVATKKMIFVK